MAIVIDSRMVSSATSQTTADASGVPRQSGVVADGRFDIASYTTNGETVFASDIGMSEIYSFTCQEGEIELHKFSNAIAADGRSVVITAIIASTAAEAGATDNVGVCSFHAAGIRDDYTENV